MGKKRLFNESLCGCDALILVLFRRTYSVNQKYESHYRRNSSGIVLSFFRLFLCRLKTLDINFQTHKCGFNVHLLLLLSSSGIKCLIHTGNNCDPRADSSPALAFSKMGQAFSASKLVCSANSITSNTELMAFWTFLLSRLLWLGDSSNIV